MSRKKLLFIATGGTFASVKTSHGLKPGFDVKQLLEKVPETKEIADIDGIQLFNIDSTNIHPTHWTKIAQAIQQNYEQVDGFVVSHGTDTMHYTAAALSFALQGNTKPVVLTGAVNTFDEEHSDAPGNFTDSVRVAENDQMSGVCICFHHSIIPGTRARKFLNESTRIVKDGLDVFESINAHPVGSVINNEIILSDSQTLLSNTHFEFLPLFDPNIAHIKLFPGVDSEILKSLSQKRAVVIEGFGPGNIPFEYGGWLEEIKRLTKNGITIIVSTQNSFGETDMERYEVGQKALESGAIPSYDMIPETALVKLMWIFGNYPDATLPEVKELFLKNTCGEILNTKK